MANLSESSATFPSGIYQLEDTDPVKGGAPVFSPGSEDGQSNWQAKQLADRTAYLKAGVDSLNAATHPSTGVFAAKASNLSDLASASTARTNLGVQSVAAADAKYAQLSLNLSDLPNKTTARANLLALGRSENLSDLSSTSTARTNLGALGVNSNLSDLGNPAAARVNLGVPTASEAVAAVFAALYPVGEVLITRRAGSPDSWLGFGTWARYAEGRTLVGYNSADTDFDTLGETGGAKTHTLVTPELPSHFHTYQADRAFSNRDGDAGSSVDGIDTASPTANTSSVGSDQPHNNMPPYIVVYMWQRTA